VGRADDEEDSGAASADVESEDSTDVPPAAFVVEDLAADSVHPIRPLEIVMQAAVSSNKVQLPVDQRGNCVKIRRSLLTPSTMG